MEEFEDFLHARRAVSAEAPAGNTAEADGGGAEGEGLQDVSAAADSAIEDDGDAAGDGFDDFGQHFERGGRIVERASAMVRDIDAVEAVLDAEAGILGSEDAFGQQGDLDDSADFFEVFPAVPTAAIGDAVGVGGVGLAWVQSAGDGAEVAAVEVALEGGGLLVDGDDDGLAASGLGALEGVAGGGHILARVELEPERAGGGSGNLVNGLAGHVADDHGGVRSGGALVGGGFAGRVELEMAGGGRDEDGEIVLGFEELEGGIGLGFRGAGDEVHPVEGFAVATHGELAVSAVGSVVVGLAGELGVGDGFEVEGAEEFFELGDAGMVTEGVLLGEEGGGTKQRGEGLGGLAAGEALRPG